MDHFRVCVVGAGPAGLTTVKNLAEMGITDIVCHEAQGETGGIWVFSDDPVRPSVYETAHTISSKRFSQFPDFPMPADYPDYPSNSQILDYMRAYEAHFGLGRYIRLNSRITGVTARDGGGWVISYQDNSGHHTQTADRLIVCSGHHRDPVTPELPGDFAGEQLHTARYKTADRFAGKKVLVVGGGNSACDIAASLSRVAGQVTISIRSPQVIVPKLVGGRPVDRQFAKLRKPQFRWARDFLLKIGVSLLVGPYKNYGLQQPRGRVLSHHPTLNTEILDRIRHGKVTARPGISFATGRSVTFADGTNAEFDVIIWATGYRLGTAFLDGICPDWSKATQVPLYLKMMLEEVPDLYFIGFIQPVGCIWVLADLQAKVAAAEISGHWTRPDDLAVLIERDNRRDAKRYKASPRHALQVETYEYCAELETILTAAGIGPQPLSIARRV